MTAAELDELERLWREGVSIKRLAYHFGYSRSGISYIARSDRVRFPPRHNCWTDARDRELWVARCLAGRCTQKQAAEALGVSPRTVRHWVALAREGAADGR